MYYDQFVDQMISGEISTIKKEFIGQRENIDQIKAENISYDYQTNEKLISNHQKFNQEKVNQTSPTNFKQGIIQETQNNLKDYIDKNIERNNKEMNLQSNSLNSSYSKLENKIQAKNKQSASGILVDSWNPLKKDDD